MTQPDSRSQSGAERVRTIVAWPAFHSREANPVNWLLYSAIEKLGLRVLEFAWWRIVFGRADAWHLHWPERYFNDRSVVRAVVKSLRLLVLMIIAKCRRIKLVWTVHNLQSHERYHETAEKYFWRVFIGLVDSYVALSPTSMRLVRQTHPGIVAKRAVLTGHGSYASEYPNLPSRDSAREELGLNADAHVVCCFGNLRAYKGVEALLIEFKKVRSAGARLIVAGLPDSKATASALSELAADDPRISISLGFQSKESLARIIRASDLVVLPFKSILHSGSAVLSLSLERPVFAPRIGAMPDLERAVGAGWLTLYDESLSADRLEEALASSLLDRRKSPALGRRFDCDEVARRTLSAYSEPS